MKRSSVWFYVRLIGGLALLIFLIRAVGVGEITHALMLIRPHLIVLAFLGIALDTVIMVYRWAVILRINWPEISFRQILRCYLISGFVGNFAPFSSDLIKMYWSSNQTSDPKVAVSSVLIDRVIGMFSLGIITLIALVALRESRIAALGASVSYSIMGLVTLAIVGPLALQTRTIASSLARLLKMSRSRLMLKIAEVCETLLSYCEHRQVIVRALVMSFGNHCISILVYYVIVQGFPTSLPVAYFFLFIPAAQFLATLPVTVGGIGVFEGAMVYLFSSVGMPMEECLGMVLCQRVLRVVGTLPGAVLYIVEGVIPNRSQRTQKPA
ncbi:MAG: flippase-like domain-containing protein [Nitrososphaera sp.]|nr:flippase-like domain-containing protein [Nitrososphaera sp.]